MQELRIKHMVCPRCVMAVQETLEKLSIPFEKVELGRILYLEELPKQKLDALEARLNALGFEILKDRDSQRIEKIKNLISTLLEKEEVPPGFLLSDHIRTEMGEDYSALSHLFSSLEGITLERYFIEQKIMKVKEWLSYEELTLSEIAWKLDYSSVQHLSSQFKRITGMTPSEHKKTRIN
jgi:AraC-like DNA-binding protein